MDYTVVHGRNEQYHLNIWLPDSPKEAKTLSMPPLFCFEQYEVDLYRKQHHAVDYFSELMREPSPLPVLL